jgi:hypothetical protein
MKHHTADRAGVGCVVLVVALLALGPTGGAAVASPATPAGQCPHGIDAAWCLTPAQVRAVRAFYRGPTDPAGRSLYNGGQPSGSELGWQDAFIAPASDTGAPADTYSARVALSYLADQTVGPYDALAAVESATGSLNGHYDYIGHYRAGRP